MQANPVQIQNYTAEPKPLWDKRQVAKFLGVSVPTVDHWVSRKQGGPKHLKIGALVRFRPEDVVSFLDECRAGERNVAA